MKKIFFSLLMLLCGQVYSQPKQAEPRIEAYISRMISQGLDRDALFRTPENFVYYYAVGIKLDDKGKIDTVYFSRELSNSVKKTFNLNPAFTKRVKATDYTFRKYASQTVLIPFFHYRMADKGINYDGGFLKDIENLIPVEVRERKYVVLDVVVNPFHETVN